MHKRDFRRWISMFRPTDTLWSFIWVYVHRMLTTEVNIRFFFSLLFTSFALILSYFIFKGKSKELVNFICIKYIHLFVLHNTQHRKLLNSIGMNGEKVGENVFSQIDNVSVSDEILIGIHLFLFRFRCTKIKWNVFQCKDTRLTW